MLKELRDQWQQKAATPLRDQETTGSGVTRARGWWYQAGTETEEGLSGQNWDLKGKAGS